MADIKIADLPSAAAVGTSVVPVSNAAGTATNKVTLADIAALASGAGDDARWDLLKPPAPTSVTAAPGNAQATVSWAAPTVLAQTPITDYVVQYSSNGGSSWTTFLDLPIVSITSQPSNQTASSGAATFSVSASVTQSATLSYQWQRSTNSGSTFTAISGATSASLALTGLVSGDNGYQYRVVVSGTGGATSVTSNAATLTVASAFTPMAVLLTSGTSYTVPSNATSMKAWAVGGGGGSTGTFSAGYGCGGGGGTAYKTWSVSGGSVATYSVGAAGNNSNWPARGGDSTITYAGTTLRGGGGATGYGAGDANALGAGGDYSGGDGGANGGAGTHPAGFAGGAVGGNSQPILMCATHEYMGRRPATNVSGLMEAVALAGGVATQVCGVTAAFGSGGHGAEKFAELRHAGLGGGAGAGYGAIGNAGGGAVVLYFT
jgi:hypothetical protein